ncbi:interferon-induced protein 44-like [Mytilus galloprovincialis]|uniref:interferon-induced protein 44-like n=1 Tax=Mytilus galloprovincialis TaxID=29158 RepID=UPI003F7CB772
MGVELKKIDQLQMNKWIDGNKKYTLLYKATRDGCSAGAFHNKCNNKGPTVTILYNINNSVFGGYTSVSWRSAGGYHADAYAFLFRLYQNGRWIPIKMPFSGSNNSSIYDDASFGPTFGAFDLKTFTGSINSSGTYYHLNGTTNFGQSYTMNGETYKSIANGHLQIKDIEVYLVEDLPARLPLDEPWRKTPKWDEKLLNALKEKIEQYKPLQELNVPHARLLLVGQVGAGKSSFFNTINSIFKGYITSQACSGNAEHSVTTVYRMYQIRNWTSGEPLNFRMHDTRGIEANQGIDAHEMCFLLDGHIPDRHQLNPSVPLSTDIPGFVTIPHLSDKIHCVVFVIDGSTIDVMPEKVIERMKALQSRMNQKGVPQVVLLTKIDKMCETSCEDLSKVFSSFVIQQTIDRVSQIIGLPRSHILPIKNYESEMELNDNVNILTLITLQHILHFCDDYMDNYLDQNEEGKMKKLSIREKNI